MLLKINTLIRFIALVTIFFFMAYGPTAGSERSESYKMKGDTYYSQKQYEKAIEEFTKAIEENPDYLAAYYNRGLANYDLHLYYKAIVDFDMVIMMKPDDKDAYFNRGLAYSKVNKLKLALSDIKKAAELGDEDARVMLANGEITDRIEKARSRQSRISALLDEKQREYNRVVTVVNTSNEFGGNTVLTTHSKGDPLFNGSDGIFKSYDYYNASDTIVKTEVLHTAQHNAANNKTKTIIWFNPDSTVVKKEFILTGRMLTYKRIQYYDDKGLPSKTVLMNKYGKEVTK